MTVPTINWTNISDPQALAQVPNTATGGWFWTVAIYLLFIVALIWLSYSGLEAAALTAAFVILMSSIYIAYASLISWWVVGSFVGIILIVGTIVYWQTRK